MEEMIDDGGLLGVGGGGEMRLPFLGGECGIMIWNGVAMWRDHGDGDVILLRGDGH